MSTASTKLAPGTWTADAAHSSIEFRVKHMMIANVKGRFSEFAATVDVAEDGAMSIEGTIEAASVDTHEKQRDEHLRSADFMDVENHPQITFRSTSVTVDDDDLTVVGDLTIRGTTRSVELEGDFNGVGMDPWGNERMALEVKGDISRKDFGLTWNQMLETGGVLVGEKIKMIIEVEAVRAAQ